MRPSNQQLNLQTPMPPRIKNPFEIKVQAIVPYPETHIGGWTMADRNFDNRTLFHGDNLDFSAGYELRQRQPNCHRPSFQQIP